LGFEGWVLGGKMKPLERHQKYLQYA